MKILIACERSGRVREAFRKKGHYAVSVDLLESDDNSEFHWQGDIFEFLTRNPFWDMMIAHPECKYLTVTANRVFKCNPERWQARLDAVNFVWKLWNADIPKIAIENPIGVLSTYIRKPDQYIQPYYFGYAESKKTGLWLKNLPLLKPTKIVEPEWIISPSGKRHNPTHWKNPSTNNPENAKLRATTYQGIADAMADQWGVKCTH
jgi:hypothetical protein